MSIFHRLRSLFPAKDSTRRSERLYQKGLSLVEKKRFLEAVAPLEEAARLNSQSAQIYQMLAFSYMGIGKEQQDDKTALDWSKKAADTFWKAITLHRDHGGLEPKQVQGAIGAMAMLDYVELKRSNTPLEEQRRAIFLEYKLEKDREVRKREDESGFVSIGDYMSGRTSLTNMYHSLQRDFNDGVDKAISHTAEKFGITERQLRVIILEGENKKW